MRIADTVRIREEYQTRLDDNSAAVAVLESHLDVWNHVGGRPHPEYLLEPTYGALVLAKDTASKLVKYKEAHENSSDGLGIFCDAMLRAVQSIKSLDWEVIRQEKYALTPESVFKDLTQNAEKLIRRQNSEQKRRQEYLAAGSDCAEAADVLQAEEEEVHLSQDTPDIYGLSLEKFKFKLPRKCHDWPLAVRYANVVHLDEIRHPSPPPLRYF